MAITITTEPTDFAPIYNGSTWVIESDNIAEPNFVYLIDVYDPSSPTKIARFRVQPNLDGYGVFDVGKVMENYITSGINLGDVQGVFQNTNHAKSYTIKFGEEYEVATVITQFPDLETEVKTYFNGALDYCDFVTYDPANIEDIFMLTDAPRTQCTYLGGKSQLGLILAGVAVPIGMTIRVYTDATTFVSYTVDNNYGSYQYMEYTVGVDDINNIDSANFSAPVTQPIIDSTTFKYEVDILLDTGIVETFEYLIKEKCEQEPKRLHWLNRWGGYDNFDFVLAWRDSIRVESKEMVRTPNRVDSNGVYSAAKTDRARTTYCTSEKVICSLTSDWIDQDVSEWIKDLFSSPDIYLETEGELVAVNLVGKEYTVKKVQYDELFNIEVQVEYSVDNIRQRG